VCGLTEEKYEKRRKTVVTSTGKRIGSVAAMQTCSAKWKTDSDYVNWIELDHVDLIHLGLMLLCAPTNSCNYVYKER
jgi:hypothetical protein